MSADIVELDAEGPVGIDGSVDVDGLDWALWVAVVVEVVSDGGAGDVVGQGHAVGGGVHVGSELAATWLVVTVLRLGDVDLTVGRALSAKMMVLLMIVHCLKYHNLF